MFATAAQFIEEATAMSTPSPPTPVESFVSLSSLLTGIAASKLAPTVDPKNIKQLYFDFAKQQAGALFDQLLSIYAAHSSEPPATIADTLFNQSGVDICFLARSIMLMWYLGSWYAPADLRAAGTHTPPPPSVVISASAYTQGWVWSAAQAHPMGFSNFSFGYWASDPPLLSDFVGGKSE